MQDSAGRVNSLDFHRSEEVLVTAGDDDSIRTYNTLTGQPTKSVYSKKYGAGNICCTHDPMSVIYTSTKVCFLNIHPITHRSSCCTVVMAQDGLTCHAKCREGLGHP